MKLLTWGNLYNRIWKVSMGNFSGIVASMDFYASTVVDDAVESILYGHSGFLYLIEAPTIELPFAAEGKWCAAWTGKHVLEEWTLRVAEFEKFLRLCCFQPDRVQFSKP